MTVVEISPGGGWYQEILAPYLSNNGQYISATYDPDSEEQRIRDRYQKEKDRLSAKKDLYGNAKMVAFKGDSYGEASSADILATSSTSSRSQPDAIPKFMGKIVLKP